MWKKLPRKTRIAVPIILLVGVAMVIANICGVSLVYTLPVQVIVTAPLAAWTYT